jgi:hypothetical protein
MDHIQADEESRKGTVKYSLNGNVFRRAPDQRPRFSLPPGICGTEEKMGI